MFGTDTLINLVGCVRSMAHIARPDARSATDRDVLSHDRVQGLTPVWVRWGAYEELVETNPKHLPADERRAVTVKSVVALAGHAIGVGGRRGKYPNRSGGLTVPRGLAVAARE